MFCQIQYYYCSQLHTIKYIQKFTVFILNYIFWITPKTFSNSYHCVLKQLYCIKHILSRLHNTEFLISDTESILHKACVFFCSPKCYYPEFRTLGNTWKWRGISTAPSSFQNETSAAPFPYHISLIAFLGDTVLNLMLIEFIDY